MMGLGCFVAGPKSTIRGVSAKDVV
jgi:hypothetical protein